MVSEKEKRSCHIVSPIGIICVETEDNYITALYIDRNEAASESACLQGAWHGMETELQKKVRRELTEYFAGERKEFDLPLKLAGTKFQMAVWEALKKIPYGETRSYHDIACAVGNPKACRAVGGANHCNPIMILVPCHRVIGKNGSLTGFGGGLDVKRALLELEQEKA